ncbi:hypothetical protein ACL02T_32955 [Pseudonocardia sp. RS010]|uniref:hypothetical protein n=1 Tax=Pseudonocardia sp. RS010 TaxID=3385979 RepID=UPI0039A0C8E1
MKRVKITAGTSIAGTAEDGRNYRLKSNEVGDVPDSLAKSWIDAGYAEAADREDLADADPAETEKTVEKTPPVASGDLAVDSAAKEARVAQETPKTARAANRPRRATRTAPKDAQAPAPATKPGQTAANTPDPAPGSTSEDTDDDAKTADTGDSAAKKDGSK